LFLATGALFKAITSVLTPPAPLLLVTPLTGVLVNGSANNIIGGTSVAARNVISGNGVAGIALSSNAGAATGNQVQGNYIGTNAAVRAL